MYSQSPACGAVSRQAACSSPVSTATRRLPSRTGSRNGSAKGLVAPNRVVCIEPQVAGLAPQEIAWLDESDRFLVEKLLNEPFEYVDHPMFDEPGTEELLFGRPAVLSPGSTWFVEHDLTGPAEAGSCLLDAETERLLFQRFNFARRCVSRILTAHRRRRLSRETLREVLGWLHRALMIRGRLAQANIPLVLSMAKRSQFSGLDPCEVVSAGNFALLRSIDRFDCARGFKFSTYACQGIIQRILHVADATRRHRGRFVSEYDETLEKDDSSDRRHESQEAEWLDDLRDILAANRAGLSGLEREVIRHRFGFEARGSEDDAGGKTLKEIGQLMGVTKERVRQIQKRALEKLRVVMERECMAA